MKSAMPDPADGINSTFDPTAPQQETQVPRADILQMVGLDEQTAKKIAEEENRNVTRLKNSLESGMKIFDQIKSEIPISLVVIGSGQFPITTAATAVDFVKEVIKASGEIKPSPPVDEVKKLLEGFAHKAVDAKELKAAAHAYNFVADGNLASRVDFTKALATAAEDDHAKFQLAQALEEIIPAPTPAPYSQPQAEPQIQTPASTQPEPQPVAQTTESAPKIKKPFLPFAKYKEPDITNGQSNGQPQVNVQTETVSTPLPADTRPDIDPNLRPVPPRPQIKLAQEIT